jgi:hypothetical protein
MTKTRTCAALALLMASQFALAATADANWEEEVRKFDSAYWQAYNRCDVAGLAAMNTVDLEFYHDVGGLTLGRDQFASAVKKNLCSDPQRGVRREAIADTIRVSPLRKSGKLYGAIISGEHQFYEVKKGANDYLTGNARFTHVLLLSEGTWKVARVLSFDHAPAKFVSKLVAVQLPVADINRLAGTFFSKDKTVFTVSPADDHLVLVVDGKEFNFFPSAPSLFFSKERDLTLAFTDAESGKGRRLVVRERGEIVEEAAARD